jgi:hypothetical protein
MQLMAYKNTTAVNKLQLFTAHCHKTSASSRRSQGLDAAAAAARRSGIRAASRRDTHERDSKKPVPFKTTAFLRAASRLRKRHCVVVKNQGLIL